MLLYVTCYLDYHPGSCESGAPPHTTRILRVTVLSVLTWFHANAGTLIILCSDTRYLGLKHFLVAMDILSEILRSSRSIFKVGSRFPSALMNFITLPMNKILQFSMVDARIKDL